MAILNESAFPVLAGEVVKQRDAETGARFVTLKAHNESGRKAKAVEIPLLLTAKIVERASNSPQFAEVVAGLVSDYQARMVQKQLAGNISTVYASSISLDALIVAYEAEQLVEGRISKDKIGAWFDAALADILTVKFADKLGISNSPSEQETKKLGQVISAYRDNFARLAARDVSLTAPQKQNLSAALVLAADDSMKQRLVSIVTEAADPEELLGL